MHGRFRFAEFLLISFTFGHGHNFHTNLVVVRSDAATISALCYELFELNLHRRRETEVLSKVVRVCSEVVDYE